MRTAASWSMSNVRGRDLGSFVDEVRTQIEKNITLPPGYYVEYGGQFENQQRASQRLMLIVPIVIAVIFVLLYITFNSVGQALLVIGNIPFALVGGDRRTVAARHEPEPLGVGRLHCAVRRRDVERRRARELDQPASRGGQPSA